MVIIDYSDVVFKNFLDDDNFFLPKRWDGKDFSKTLKDLFEYYKRKLQNYENVVLGGTEICEGLIDIEKMTKSLIESVDNYLNGFPAKALESFEKVMEILKKHPLHSFKKNEKNEWGTVESETQNAINLFRAVRVCDNKPYDRTRVFHTPYNLRSKVSTSRFSIAGYPSLYLSTSLELCCEEINADINNELIIASKFKMGGTKDNSNFEIEVIELGIKPQDFLEFDKTRRSERLKRVKRFLNDEEKKSAYLIWYPLIAACSFIRINKKDPFAAEYIIPQLLMQWVRSEVEKRNKNFEIKRIIGIRYFSCASSKASEMGFNYVFPTSGEIKSSENPYCATLTKVFCLTKPVYIHEYESILKCEQELAKFNDTNYGLIN